MSISPKTAGIHHIALRVSDLPRAKRFYVELLGFPILLDTPDLLIVAAGQTAIGLRAPAPETPPGDVFDPRRLGLDHLALACAEEAELLRVANALQGAGVENTGVKTDETLGKKYVAFKDPDRIAWEYYAA